MTAHQQLRATYLASGLTMAEIARRAGCSENTVLRIVGLTPRNVRADVLLAVAGAIGHASISVQTATSSVVK